jgi:hypothetical protein
MAVSVANFKTALDGITAAIDADDLTLAKKWLAKAEIQLAGLERSQSGDGESLTRRESLEAVRAALDDYAAAVEADADEPSGDAWEIHSRGVI